MSNSPEEITKLLNQIIGNDSLENQRLFELVYDELRKIAHRYMAKQESGITLQTTAVVHEAYIKLVDKSENPVQWENRAHFFGYMASVMRGVVIDHYRARKRQRRGGEYEHLVLEEALAAGTPAAVDIESLDEALKRLGEYKPDLEKIVEMRFFGGLKVAEVAAVLQIDERTVKRRWAAAKAWLFEELRNE